MPEHADITRQTVVTIFREAENAALMRHWGQPASDGTGQLRVSCGCGSGLSVLDWEGHLLAVVKQAHEVKPR